MARGKHCAVIPTLYTLTHIQDKKAAKKAKKEQKVAKLSSKANGNNAGAAKSTGAETAPPGSAEHRQMHASVEEADDE
jgi:hypothetical protein